MMTYPQPPMTPKEAESYAKACNDLVCAVGRGMMKVFNLLALRAGPQKSAAPKAQPGKPQPPRQP